MDMMTFTTAVTRDPDNNNNNKIILTESFNVFGVDHVTRGFSWRNLNRGCRKNEILIGYMSIYLHKIITHTEWTTHTQSVSVCVCVTWTDDLVDCVFMAGLQKASLGVYQRGQMSGFLCEGADTATSD